MKSLLLVIGVALLSGCTSGSVRDAGTGSRVLPRVVSMTDVQVSPTDSPRVEQLPVVTSSVLRSSDEDFDGIIDSSDRCKGSTPSSLVNTNGCEIVTGVIEGLKFAPNEVTLSVDSRVVLSNLVDVFSRYPNVNLAVDGHTDNRGAAAANLELSKQRVLSVVRYMVSNGINPERLEPFGYGESRPRAANATEEGREQNRRIEINVIDRLP